MRLTACMAVLGMFALGCSTKPDDKGDGKSGGEDAVAIWKRGLERYQKKEFDAAITEFTAAIKQDPKYAPSYRDRGAAYTQTKKYEEAVTDLTEYIKLRPEDPEGYEFRALAYDKLGNVPKRTADLRAADKLRAKKP